MPLLSLSQGKYSKHRGCPNGGRERTRWGRGGSGWRKHGWGKTRGGEAEVGDEQVQKGESEPEGGLLTNTSDAVEETCAGALPGWAGEDGVFKRFRFQAAAGAGGVSFRGPPGGVGTQITFPGSHLLDSPHSELVESNERPRVQGEGMVVICRWGEESRPVHDGRVPDPFFQGRICARHQGLRGEVGPKIGDLVRIYHGHP